MFPNKPKYHQILPFFWFLFVFESYVILKSRTIELVKKSSLQYPSEESATSSPGLFPFSKGKPGGRGWSIKILDIIGTKRGSSSVSRLCLTWIELFQRCHDGQLNSLSQCWAYFYDVASSGWLGCCLVFSWCFRCDTMRRRAGSILTWLSQRMSKRHLLLRTSHFYLCSRPTKHIVNGTAYTIEL